MKKITAYLLVRWAFFLLVLAFVLVEAGYLRGVGLWHGLSQGVEFHPDAAKQVMALDLYLKNQYIWYFHTPFIDGYPLALSHVDEWLLRALLLVPQGLADLVSRGAINVMPEGFSLFYWVRCLRWIYGMLALLLFFFAAKTLFRSRWWALFALVILTFSPISYTVTHFGTGDVGVDLFCSALLLFLALYLRRPHLVYLFLAGLMAGGAFAVKYQGAISFYLIGAFLGLLWLGRSLSFLQLLGRGLTALGGLLLGAVLLNPGLLLASERTWKDMRQAMSFIANYNLDSQFLALPFYVRWWTGLSSNLPLIGRWIGVISLLLALAALILVSLRLYRRWQKTDFAETACLWTVFSFPILGLLLFCSAKLENQPSHFSFLLYPLALASAYALRWLWHRHLLGKLTVALLILAGIVESEWQTRREVFFWQHSEVSCLARDYGQKVLGDYETVPGCSSNRILKYFYLEANNPVVFRNRCQAVQAPAGTVEFCRRLAVTPGPTVPLDTASSWIFLNGPVLPCDDHEFAVKAGTTVKKELVCYDSWPLALGVRSGYLPVKVKLQIGGRSYSIRLDPQQQTLISVDPPKRWRIEPFPGDAYKQINIVPLTVCSQPGDCWITAIASEKELENFRLFGGEQLAALTNLTAGYEIGTVVSNLASLALYKSSEIGGVALPRKDGKFSSNCWCLPAGRYRLECTVAGLAATNSLVLLNDAWGKLNSLAHWEIGPVVTSLVYKFSKSYAPYENTYQLCCLTGATIMASWRLLPDTEAILADLRDHDATGQVPAWFEEKVSPPLVPEQALTNIIFACGKLALTGYAYPSLTTQPAVGLRFKLLDHGLADFAELYVFAHFIDDQGQLVQSMDYPLFLFTVGDGALKFLAPPQPLPPGRYTLTIGVYNVRTETRLKLAKKVDSRAQWRKRNELQLPGILEVRITE